ncbi:MAG: hypothetical protein KKI07_02325, partial [Euryarchaeota archaeon]|nr:hypothetical protein [Euryarchaeota archaeon]
SHCTVQDKRSMIRLDVKEVYDEMDRRTLRRRIAFEHMGTRIYLASSINSSSGASRISEMPREFMYDR